MKHFMHVAAAVLIALASTGCREDAGLIVLFAGDERGYIVPVG